MKSKIIFLSTLILSIILLITTVFAYETYEISAADLESGYTKELSQGDRINFPIGDNIGYVSVPTIYVNSAQMGIFAHDRILFNTEEHPDFDIGSNERKFEMTEDNFYDILVTLNSATINENDNRIASVTLKKINEEIPEGAENYYDCWKYHVCSDGTKIKNCDYSSNGMCLCRAISSSECPTIIPDDEENEMPNSTSNVNNSNNSQRMNNNSEIPTNKNITNNTFELSNGRKAEIKIMPSTASSIAISKLGELNFTVELKEVGTGQDVRVVYELTGNKQGKFLGIFKIMAKVQTQIDAETGEVIKVIKPWWSFMATGV